MPRRPGCSRKRRAQCNLPDCMWVTGKGCRAPLGLPGVLSPNVLMPPFVASAPLITPLASVTAMQARIAQLEAQVRECQAQLQAGPPKPAAPVKSKQFIFLLPGTSLQPLPPLAADALRSFASGSAEQRPLLELLGQLHVMEVAEVFDETGCLATPAGQKVAAEVDAQLESLPPDQGGQFFALKHKLAKYCLSKDPSNPTFRDCSILMALAANVSFVYQARFFNMYGLSEYAQRVVITLIPAFLQGGAAVQQWLDTVVAIYIDRLQNYPSRKKEYLEAAKQATKYKEFVEKVIKA